MTEKGSRSRLSRALRVADIGCNTLLIVLTVAGLLVTTPLVFLWWSGN